MIEFQNYQGGATKRGGISFVPFETLAENEKKFITDRYWFCNQDIKRMALSLGISVTTVRKKLREYGLL